MPHPSTTSKEGKDKAREAHPNGHHATPVSCIVQFFNFLTSESLVNDPPDRVLDLGAGDLGGFGFAAKWVWPRTEVTGIEQRVQANPPADFYDVFTHGDYLDPLFVEANGNRYDLIAANPTFKIAEETVRAAVKMLRPFGVLSLFLPQNFQFGKDRAEGLHMELPPSIVMPIAPRPGFYEYRPDKAHTSERSNTNYRDYNWVVWIKPSRGHSWGARWDDFWKDGPLWRPFTWQKLPTVENKFKSYFAFLWSKQVDAHKQMELI